MQWKTLVNNLRFKIHLNFPKKKRSKLLLILFVFALTLLIPSLNPRKSNIWGSLIYQDKASSNIQNGLASVDVTKSVRPTFTNVVNAADIKKLGLSTGASWADIDGDGYSDLLILGGRDGTRLFRNNHNETFTDITTSSGILENPTVRDITDTGWTAGVFGDYDNDGCVDLYVSVFGITQNGRNDRLYHNNCNSTFTEVTKSAGISDNFVGHGAAWADYDNDGLLDLYVANYGQSAENFKIEPNILYHNLGHGKFEATPDLAGVAGIAKCQKVGNAKKRKLSYQPIWFDYNNDGKIDLFVTTDSGVSPLYRNNGDGTFTDVTQESGLCYMGTGMGVTVGDYNNDGYLDLYQTNTGKNYLWKNNGNGTFSEESEKAKVGDFSLGWGASFLDYDNDGYLDLYVVNGSVVDAEHKLPNNGRFDRSQSDNLYRGNSKAVFNKVTVQEGIEGFDAKEALAVGDFNNDGFPDLFVVSSFASPVAKHRLYRNRGNDNHWLTVRLRGTRSNRDAVGARLEIRSGNTHQIREISAGSNYLGENSLWPTFGLGGIQIIDSLEIRWPSGKLQTLAHVTSNQILTVTEEK